MKIPYRLKASIFTIFLLIFYSTPLFAQGGETLCGSLKSSFGPFDYRTERGNNLYLVESAHFTPKVEALIKGNTTTLGGDLAYTLRAFPNHHKALISMMRFGEKTKSDPPPYAGYSIECYMDRAIRFRPDDSIARMIYSIFLTKAGRKKDAIFQLDAAAEAAEERENPFTHYNLGLNYLENKEYDKALIQAHKAYGLGFLQPELRDRLIAAGKWKEPDTAASNTEAPSSSPTQ